MRRRLGNPIAVRFAAAEVAALHADAERAGLTLSDLIRRLVGARLRPVLPVIVVGAPANLAPIAHVSFTPSSETINNSSATLTLHW